MAAVAAAVDGAAIAVAAIVAYVVNISDVTKLLLFATVVAAAVVDALLL